MRLESAQCAVRTHRPEDAPSLARHGNNRRIWENLRDRFPHPYTTAHAEGYIAHLLATPSYPSFVIEVDGEAVGGISLHLRDDIERIGAEVGYWLGEAYWGRGIVSDAIGLLTRYAFDELSLIRLFAIPFVENTASRRALEKNDYALEGIMRSNAIKDGRVRDSALYARIRQ